MSCRQHAGNFHLLALLSEALIDYVPCKQCLRRWVEEKDAHQRDNAAKYMSAFIAVGLRQAYTNYRNMPADAPLLVLMIIASIIATIFTNYWDVCIDWGLLNKQSRNKWLRDKIILKNKSLYFIAMVSNLTAVFYPPK